MSVGIWFWILFVVFLVLGGWTVYPFDRRSSGFFVVMILIGLLGWGLFGPPIH